MTSSATDATARAMSEKELSQNVVDMARVLGWMCYRTWNSQHSPSGFPDLVCIRRNPDRGFVAELKREGKHPSEQQVRWLASFDAIDIQAYVWRPSDWLSGEIETVLTWP